MLHFECRCIVKSVLHEREGTLVGIHDGRTIILRAVIAHRYETRNRSNTRVGNVYKGDERWDDLIQVFAESIQHEAGR
jgi:hypothetical protein